jgi:hypothetical protein
MILLTFVLAFFFIKLIIITRYKYILKHILPLGAISTKNIIFKWIYDFDKTYTIDSFKFKYI